jgi:hypothetical protein
LPPCDIIICHNLGRGTIDFSQIHFHLSELLDPIENLGHLLNPLTTEEIDSIVANLPSRKSLDLDGFNTNFMNKCWRVISTDFYQLCYGFYDNNICLESINGSYIVLIPNMDNPSTDSDYRQFPS